MIHRDDGFGRSYQEVGFGTRQEYGPSLHNAFGTPKEMRNWIASQNPSPLIQIRQSDEGGRFMHVKATYQIALIKDCPPRHQYPFGQWIPLSVMEELVARPGATTNELRTIASMILSTEFDEACAKE